MANVPSQPPEPPPEDRGRSSDWSEVGGKLTAAKGPDQMILIAGAVFIVASFLPWYGFRIAGFGANISGWNSGAPAVLSILLAIAATAFAVMRVLGVDLNLGRANDGLIYLSLGGGAFFFVLLRLLTQTSLTRYGLYIALIAGAFLAFGGWQKYRALQP